MKNPKSVTAAVACFVLLSSCASSYKSIRPELFTYTPTPATDSLEFSYHYDVLSETRNKKYAKKETRKYLKLVMVRIVNHTGHPLNPLRDVHFFANGQSVTPVDQLTTGKMIRQSVPSYLLYLLLTPLNVFYTTPSNDPYSDPGGVQRQVIPVGFVVGPGITAANMIVAGNANKKFRDELQRYSLDVEVKDGQSAYGLIAFDHIGYDPLTVRLKK